MDFSDPRLYIRIFSIFITTVTVAAVVAGAIAIGVIVSRGDLNGLSVIKPAYITQGMVSVAMDRALKADEQQKYYNFNTTAYNLANSIAAQLRKSFPATFRSILVTGISNPPVSNPYSRSLNTNSKIDQLVAVFVNASVFFTENYTAKQLGATFIDFTADITLEDVKTQPSTAPGTFSPTLSTFTDTVQVASLPSGTGGIVIDLSNSSIGISSTTPVMAG